MNPKQVTPLFLFSLPRAGSTMAQRILSAHEQIATASEPWVLLPYLYTLRKRGVYAEYGHSLATAAIDDFCQVLPEGREDYLLEMRAFMLRLYGKAAQDDSHYFLDKTPRYHLVVEDIIRLFPEGKFVFLWRNPLAVVASIMETWAGGKWNLYHFKVDLFDGLENLIQAYQKHSDRVCAVRYEDLISDPVGQWSRVFDYLNLSFDPAILENFSRVKLQGSMGDPTGTRLYSHVSKEPLEKWKRTLANPVRKTWCRRYLHWIGEQRLAVMGYELDGLLAELDSIPASSQRLGSDVLRNAYGLTNQLFEPAMLKRKLLMSPSWERVHEHR